MSSLKVSMAQLNPLVGAIDANTAQIIALAETIIDEDASDIIIYPELVLTGYPPEDLLLRPSLKSRIEGAVTLLCEANLSAALLVSYPRQVGDKLYNMAGLIFDGKVQFEYAKQCLPNYQVFDEKRYFTPGDRSGVFDFKGLRIGVTICEDIWNGAPLAQLKDVDLVLNLNASPFHQGKQAVREKLVCGRANEVNAPIFFVNQVGGQDELVFDGASFVAVPGDGVISRFPQFELHWQSYVYDSNTRVTHSLRDLDSVAPLERLDAIYSALVLGVRDYVNKNRFKGVLLGLSGGIDSALTLAIATDALGPDRVQAVMMPFRYTSQMSRDDAAKQADTLGVKYRSISIEPIYESFMQGLQSEFEGLQMDTTEQNIQARSRGVILMALSNKLGYLVLTTGNKSEMAVGYATLYGDMAGGLDVLKDVPKTLVYALSSYRNRDGEVIPNRVIERPPSAELAPDQVDEDSLPPYEILDEILDMYIERDMSHDHIVEKGFDSDIVRKVLRLVDINEYKRRQAPIGIRISERAFGRDRRYPITNGWPIGS